MPVYEFFRGRDGEGAGQVGRAPILFYLVEDLSVSASVVLFSLVFRVMGLEWSSDQDLHRNPLASLIVAMVWVPRVLGLVSFHPWMGEVQVRDQFHQDPRK